MSTNYFEKSKKPQKNPYKDFNKGFKEFKKNVLRESLLWAQSAEVLEKLVITIDDGSLTLPDIYRSEMDQPNKRYEYKHPLSFHRFNLNPRFRINHIDISDYGVVDEDDETLILSNHGSTFSMERVDVKPKKREYNVHCVLEGKVQDIYDLSSSRALRMKLDIWGYMEPAPKWEKYVLDALRQLNKNNLEEAFKYLFNAFEALLPRLVPEKNAKDKVFDKLVLLQDKLNVNVPIYVSAFRLARNDLTHDKEEQKAAIKKKDIFIFLLLIRELGMHEKFFELPKEKDSLIQPDTDLIRVYGAIHKRKEKNRLKNAGRKK